MKSVKDVMQRDVVTVTPDTSVRQLLRILAQGQISGVPVVAEGGRTLGVVSATDVIRLAVGESELTEGSLGLEGVPILPEDLEEESGTAYFYHGGVGYPSLPEGGDVPEGFFEGYTVSDIMTPAAFTVGPNDEVRQVARFLLSGRIHRALVVEEERLQGIVTTFDLLRALVGEETEGDR